MNDNYFKVQEAFNSAMAYANKSVKSCESCASDYFDNNVLYQKLTFKSVLFVVLKLIGAFALLFVGVFALSTNLNINDTVYIPVLSIIMLGLGIVLLAACGYTIFRMVYSCMVKKGAKYVGNFSPELQNSIRHMKDYATKINCAINKREDLILEQPTDIESELIKFKQETAVIQKKSRTIKQITLSALFAILTLAGFIFFSNTIIKSLNITDTPIFGIVPVLSYMGFYTIIVADIQHLAIYYGEKLKYGLLGLFVVFQATIIITLLNSGIIEKLLERNPILAEMKNKVFVYFETFVLNYQTITILLSTLMIVILIIKLDISLMIHRSTNSVVIPMIGGPDVYIDAGKSKNVLIWRIILAMIFACVCGVWMANIVVQGPSFGRFLLCALIGLIWGGVSRLFASDKFIGVFDESAIWIRLSVFSAYIIATLSILPHFSVGTIFLFALQYVMIYIAALVFLLI